MTATAKALRDTRRSGDKLTVAEICADLDISPRTFYEWRAKGTAPKCIPLPSEACASAGRSTSGGFARGRKPPDERRHIQRARRAPVRGCTGTEPVALTSTSPGTNLSRPPIADTPLAPCSMTERRPYVTAANPGGVPLPPVYLPRDIAKALHCSEWWVKEQARRGRIPFSKPGGRYRFTAEHFAEIMRIFESRPTESGSTVAAAPPARRRQAGALTVPVTRLRARTPRRSQHNRSQSTAA